MIGAILGDMIGAPYEFDRGDKTKDFELFTEYSEFTDDSVMSLAVAEGLLDAGRDATPDEIRAAVTECMQKWGHKYPDAGYGGRFYHWLFGGKNPKPYGSYGNGSAMRVSAVGWLYDTLDRTLEVAAATADVTHNHPEGIKGAQATAAAIFMARHGATKDEIKAYIVNNFGYNLSRTCDEIRPTYHHVESCQETVPEAITAFLEAESFEDAIRTAVSLGGDTDTLAAITGGIAEAFYGVPVKLIIAATERLSDELNEVLSRFNSIVHPENGDGEYAENRGIAIAAALLSAENDPEKRTSLFYDLMGFVLSRVQQNGEAPTPFIDKDNALSEIDVDELSTGETFTLKKDIRIEPDTMIYGDGTLWLPLFTDNEERSKGQTANICINYPIENILRAGLAREDIAGVVINPFSSALTLPKEILGVMLDVYERQNGNSAGN